MTTNMNDNTFDDEHMECFHSDIERLKSGMEDDKRMEFETSEDYSQADMFRLLEKVRRKQANIELEGLAIEKEYIEEQIVTLVGKLHKINKQELSTRQNEHGWSKIGQEVADRKYSAEIEVRRDECYQEYHMFQKTLSDVEDSCREFVQNQLHKQQIEALSKVLLEPLSFLNDNNQNTILKILEILWRLLRGEMVPLPNGKDSAFVGVHPSAIKFCLSTLAMEIVNYAEKPISDDNVKGLAILSASACLMHADFGNLLFGHLSKKCPLVIPYFDKNVACANFKQTSRIMTFYSTLLTSSPVPQIQGGGSYRAICMNRGMEWLKRLLSFQPVGGTSAGILEIFLTIVAKDLTLAHGLEFRKSLDFVVRFYVPKIKQLSGPKDNASLFLLKEALDNILYKK